MRGEEREGPRLLLPLSSPKLLSSFSLTQSLSRHPALLSPPLPLPSAAYPPPSSPLRVPRDPVQIRQNSSSSLVNVNIVARSLAAGSLMMLVSWATRIADAPKTNFEFWKT
ncbi:hypothetical protein Droror1_Dr00026944 [Drosera rotundifolia]